MSTTMLPTPLLEEPQQKVETQGQIFEQALHERDITKLYSCLDWLALLKRHHPAQYALKKADIKVALNGHLGFDMRDLGSAVSAEVRSQERALTAAKQDIADVAVEWARLNREKWAYDEHTHSWYIWSDSHWQEQQDKCLLLDQEAINSLQDAGIAVNSTQSINCFLRVAASSPYCRRDFSRELPGKINFANGTLDVATGHLSTFQKNDQITYCLNYHYNPTGSHTEIDAYLARTIPDEHGRQSLIAHIGLALMRDTSFHNFGLLIGPPRSGKSTVLALTNATACGMIDDPFRFAGPSLFARDLEGKRSRAKWSSFRSVCADELPAEALKEEEILKAMSAHSGVEMRLIGKDERTDNRWKPKMLMSTNDTPHYKDVSGAVGQRVLIIECPNGPMPENQQNKELFSDKLLPEIGAFAATCIKFALAVKQRGSYPRSAKMRQMLDEIEHLGNPLKAFIRECCILEPGAKLTSDVLHKTYADYIVEGGNFAMAKNKMSSAIRDMHIGVSTGEWMRFNNRPSRALKGIRLRTDFDGDPQDPLYQSDPLLFSPSPTPPSAGQDVHEGTEQSHNEEEMLNASAADENQEERLLNYPACMAQDMEPAPTTACPTCQAVNYVPYWGKWATKKWGCAACYPEIVERLGLYNPENPPQ